MTSDPFPNDNWDTISGLYIFSLIICINQRHDDHYLCLDLKPDVCKFG